MATLKNGTILAAKKSASRFALDVNEISALENIGHGSEHVVGYFGHNSSFLLLEYCPNGNLRQYIEAYEAQLMPQSEVLSFSHQLLHGLDLLHSKGVFHGDFKPDNIVLDAQYKLKITDFGSVTLKGNLWSGLGTEGYMPPEARDPGGHLPAPVDMWSLGVTIFNMMYGRNPYSNLDPDKCEFMNELVNRNYEYLWTACDMVRAGVTPDFKRMLESLLEPEPSRRATIEQLRRNSWFCQNCHSCPWCLSTPIPFELAATHTISSTQCSSSESIVWTSPSFPSECLEMSDLPAGSSRFPSPYVTFLD